MCIGDVVNQNQGGPLMTVEDIGSDNRVGCVWFQDGQLHRELFNREELINWIRKEDFDVER